MLFILLRFFIDVLFINLFEQTATLQDKIFTILCKTGLLATSFLSQQVKASLAYIENILISSLSGEIRNSVRMARLAEPVRRVSGRA